MHYQAIGSVRLLKAIGSGIQTILLLIMLIPSLTGAGQHSPGNTDARRPVIPRQDQQPRTLVVAEKDQQLTPEEQYETTRTQLLERLDESIAAMVSTSQLPDSIDFSLVWPALKHQQVFSLERLMSMAASYDSSNKWQLGQFLGYTGSIRPASDYPYALFYLAVASQYSFYQRREWQNPNARLYVRMKEWLENLEFELSQYDHLIVEMTPYDLNLDRMRQDLELFLQTQNNYLNDITVQNSPLVLAYSFAFWQEQEQEQATDLISLVSTQVFASQGAVRAGEFLNNCYRTWSGQLTTVRTRIIELILNTPLLQRYSPRCPEDSQWDCTEATQKRESVVLIQNEHELRQSLGQLIKDSRHMESAWFLWKLNPYEQQGHCTAGDWNCRHPGQAEQYRVKTSQHPRNPEEGLRKTLASAPDIQDKPYLIDSLANGGVGLSWFTFCGWLDFPRNVNDRIDAESYRHANSHSWQLEQIVNELIERRITYKKIFEALEKMGKMSTINTIRKHLKI